MSILVNTGFKVGGAEPLNEYSVRETLDDRDDLVTNGYVYEGMEVYCKDTKIKYRWNGAAWDILDNAPTDESTHKTTIYENNIDMGKYLLLAKITGANYSNNIIKFSCPNYKGTNDTGFKYEDDMDIYKFELHFNTGSRRENNGYGVTLKQHGLGLYSYPLDNPQNTEPRIVEAIRLYWDYNKGDIYVFLVDIMTAIPHCVLEYTGSGTLLRDNTFVMDDLYNRREGLNGTWEESRWKSIPYNKLEVPPIHELGGEGSSAEGMTTYTSIEELGLTADATFQDVIDTLPKGGSALLGVKNFTNYQTIFPYEEGNDQFARVHIVKGLEDGSCMYARWFRKDGVKEAIAKFNINDNKFNGWQRITIGNTKKTLAFNSKTFKIDITKGNENWNGNMKFGYVVDRSYGEINISSMGRTEVLWDCSEGVRYVKSVTYTIDPNNNAHVTIGVELYNIAYGVHQLEMTGDFATINSFTGDAFTGTSVAKRGGTKGRNNGVGLLCEVEDLGLTFPCTTVQIVQAMRDLSNTAYRMPSNSMIGIFNCGPKAETITDAPTDYGLLHVETNGHDRVSIRFDSISRSNYAGSWIGQIQGNNGAFSGVTWERTDNTYSTTEQAVGTWIDGKTIYRKVIEVGQIDAALTESNVPLCDLGFNSQNIIKFTGIVNSLGNMGILPYAHNDSYDIISYFSSSKLRIKGTWKHPVSAQIIVEYTK